MTLCALAAVASTVMIAPSPLGASSPLTYVALGDSFASGEGLAPFVASVPSTCDRSALSYPYLTASALGVGASGAFIDVACAGARLSDLDASVGAAAPQLDAVTDSSAVVTLQSGGNDVFFGELAAGCLNTARGGSSASMGQAGCDYWVLAAERLLGVTTGDRALWSATLYARYRSVLESRLLTVIAAIRARQGANGGAADAKRLLAVLDYPVLLARLTTSSLACVVGPGFSYAAKDALTLRAINLLLDEEIQRASALYATRHHDAGIIMVDVSRSLRPLSCGAGPGASDVRAIDPSHPGYSLHPLASGQAKMANAVAAALGARGVGLTAPSSTTSSSIPSAGGA
ncbi:MAG TPA: GDSL-type esterase/lipase family protein [Acidimicrobiales bacterium]|nr:GDSL-type esterase/lipase family protein [Acidimicrobiales bacterium]